MLGLAQKPEGHRLDVIVATSAYGNYLKRSLIESNRTNLYLCRPVPRLRRNDRSTPTTDGSAAFSASRGILGGLAAFEEAPRP